MKPDNTFEDHVEDALDDISDHHPPTGVYSGIIPSQNSHNIPVHAFSTGGIPANDDLNDQEIPESVFNNDVGDREFPNNVFNNDVSDHDIPEGIFNNDIHDDISDVEYSDHKIPVGGFASMMDSNDDLNDMDHHFGNLDEIIIDGLNDDAFKNPKVKTY